MSISLSLGEVSVDLSIRRFPAGETFVRLPDMKGETYKRATIYLSYEGDNDLFALALLVDAVRREFPKIAITLHMPYLPYARQDRVCAPGESLSIKVVASFINALALDKVVCHDVHSSVGMALIDNLQHIGATALASPLSWLDTGKTVLVSPDAGANKKVADFAKAHKFPNVVRADKNRNVLTNEITGTVVYSEHIGNSDFLILDDICDGGRTFIELGKELRKKTDGKVLLYVTHGIFSAGMDVFAGIIDKIYVSNLMNETVRNHPLLEIL